MPAVSQSQRRWAYWADAHRKQSGVSHKVAEEFKSHGVKGLPEHVRKKSIGGIAAYGLAKGGSVKVYGAGNSGEEVRQIQSMLAAAGFDPGRADASYGKNTEQAVREFQAAHGLNVDGRVGKETLGALKAMSVPNPRPRPKGLGSFDSSGPDVAFNEGSGFSAPRVANELDVTRPKGLPVTEDWTEGLPPIPPLPSRKSGLGATTISKPASNVTVATHSQERETDPVINHMATSNRDWEKNKTSTEGVWNLQDRLNKGPMPLNDQGFDFARGGTKQKPSMGFGVGANDQGIAVANQRLAGPPQRGRTNGEQSRNGGDTIDMAKATPFKSGMIKSSVPGRTDRLPLVVDKDAFVWPADLVSGLGQGNSDAGAQILGDLMSQYEATNDGTSGNAPAGDPVPIVAAGGEFITDPQTVAAVGGGDLKKGHKLLKNAVVSLRKQIAKHMLSLPGPK